MSAWCTHCGDYCPQIRDPDNGYLCCVYCGKVIHQDFYTEEPQFMKGSNGQSIRVGSTMQSVELGSSASYQRTLQKGRDEMYQLVDALNIAGGDAIVNSAHIFYKIAVDRRFTRGRRTSHVAASCLYISCRQVKKAYLLIDFSDHLQISVYVLGAVFLQLCEVLKLERHPIIQKLVDPSLFIHRFTECLLKRRNNSVTETALRIIASMKRDWMQTGRKPSGLCGAALYISALSHGFDYSKADVVTVVHVCEATLTKRLIEFENTESGSLTIEEFLSKADDVGEDHNLKCSPKPGEVLCEHKDSNAQHYAHGLCQKCYEEFINISGGLNGGSEPPAFQRAERQRMEAAKREAEHLASSKEIQHDVAEEEAQLRDIPVENEAMNGERSQQSTAHDGDGSTVSSLNLDGNAGEAHAFTDDDFINSKESVCDKSSDPNREDEPESLSDIDDCEVAEYLHNEEEAQYKKIIWEEMNREYLEEQASKEAAAAMAAAEDSKPKKERKRKRADDASNATPAETPAEATCNILKKKGLASKVNLDAVGNLYNIDDDAIGKKEETSEANDAGEDGAVDDGFDFWD